MKQKVSSGLYHIVEYYGGPVIAVIVKTGARRDPYPWDWYLYDGVRFGIRDGKRPQGRGTTQTLGEAVDLVESRIKQYGVETVETDGDSTKPA